MNEPHSESSDESDAVEGQESGQKSRETSLHSPAGPPQPPRTQINDPDTTPAATTAPVALAGESDEIQDEPYSRFWTPADNDLLLLTVAKHQNPTCSRLPNGAWPRIMQELPTSLSRKGLKVLQRRFCTLKASKRSHDNLDVDSSKHIPAPPTTPTASPDEPPGKVRADPPPRYWTRAQDNTLLRAVAKYHKGTGRIRPGIWTQVLREVPTEVSRRRRSDVVKRYNLLKRSKPSYAHIEVEQQNPDPNPLRRPACRLSRIFGCKQDFKNARGRSAHERSHVVHYPCPICNKVLCLGSTEKHMRVQHPDHHNVVVDPQLQPNLPPVSDPAEFNDAFGVLDPESESLWDEVLNVIKMRKMDPLVKSGLAYWLKCLTCRKNGHRCDQVRPRCGRCSKLGLRCIYANENPVQQHHGEETIESLDAQRANFGGLQAGSQEEGHDDTEVKESGDAEFGAEADAFFDKMDYENDDTEVNESGDAEFGAEADAFMDKMDYENDDTEVNESGDAEFGADADAFFDKMDYKNDDTEDRESEDGEFDPEVQAILDKMKSEDDWGSQSG